MDDFDRNVFIIRKIIGIGRKLLRTRKGDIAAYGPDLGISQVEALVFLNANPGADISTLSEYLGISHQGTRDMLGRLMKKGLAATRPSEADKRARQIFLTDKGREICMDQRKRGAEIGAHLFGRLGEEEKKLLLSLLDRISPE